MTSAELDKPMTKYRREIDVVEFRLADMFDMGQEMTACEHGKYRNRYSDYEYLTPSETTAKHKADK